MDLKFNQFELSFDVRLSHCVHKALSFKVQTTLQGLRYALKIRPHAKILVRSRLEPSVLEIRFKQTL